jgi:tRNA nucleotidyltransferase (CCA-adding enzyme)
LRALHLIDRLDLYSTIFTDPAVEDGPSPSTMAWAVAYNCLDELRVNETPGSIYKSLVRSEDAKYLAWILAALTPWSTVPQTMSIKSKGKPSIILGASVAREGIKAETKMCNVVAGAFKHYKQITALKDAVKRNDAYTKERDTIGMTIRGWDAQGGHWRLQALFALLVEAMYECKPIGTMYEHPKRVMILIIVN